MEQTTPQALTNGQKNRRRVLLIIVIFIAGFLTHALIFPDFLANGFTDVKNIAIPNASPNPQAPGGTSTFETKITYDGTHFSRHNVTIGVGNYLIITNVAQQHPMWLISNNPQLATPRGYGESEQIRERMDTVGQFVVADKNNQSERLVITVK